MVRTVTIAARASSRPSSTSLIRGRRPRHTSTPDALHAITPDYCRPVVARNNKAQMVFVREPPPTSGSLTELRERRFEQGQSKRLAVGLAERLDLSKDRRRDDDRRDLAGDGRQ